MSPTFDRAAVLAGISAVGRDAVDPFTTAVDGWLRDLFDDTFGQPSGIALVATGGHGRAELTPGSDLDLLLLHDGRIDPDAARDFWYPIWDSGIKLGHAVRTVGRTLTLARDDLATATSLLSVRHLAGDTALSDELALAGRRQWAKAGRRVLSELADAVVQRHRDAGDVAFALEPDLKEGRGGMRDVLAIGWACDAVGELDAPREAPIAEAYGVLLDARVELHRVAKRHNNRLLLQDQDDVAGRLGLTDADALMARVAAAGRMIGLASDEFWFDVARMARSRGGRKGDAAQHLGHGIWLEAGRVTVFAPGSRADTARAPALDALAPLRVTVAAATRATRIDRATLAALADAPPLPEPWPPEARRLFVELLACGRDAVAVIESLDLAGLWVPLVPEWEPNRSRPQRNAYHRFTVDRHLLEATANAAEIATRVDRSDLLLLGTLLHDIGKGYPGDHATVGEDLARAVCTRMGLAREDVAAVELLVRHHLLLADVATRRDLDDPVTIASVAEIVGDVETLEMLWALTEADASATGPVAWSAWRAELVADLVGRTRRVLAGEGAGETVSPSMPPPGGVERAALIERCRQGGVPAVCVDGDHIVVVAPDRPALFSRVAGVLALHGLDVVEATVGSEDGMAVDEFRVESAFGGHLAVERLEADLDRALRGRLAIEARLADRARSYRRTPNAARALDRAVRVLPDASENSTVVEVVGPDSVGLLFRLARAFADLDLDIVSAKVATMSADVVDAFYVRPADGSKITDADDIAEIRTALLHAL